MTLFSDDRAAELRELFFESAQEMLQALNEEGLELEKRPHDPEIVRNIRRTVHTLKGDSAACGFRDLSDLAHLLEDVLTPELAEDRNELLPQLVLSAADTFEAMLGAYRASVQPPPADSMRELIRAMSEPPQQAEVAEEKPEFAPAFAWTEYERLLISNSAVRGQSVYNVAVEIDPNSSMNAAAVQLVRNVMQEVGTVLACRPEEGLGVTGVCSVEAAIATYHPQQWLEKKCSVPSIVSRIVVAKAPTASPLSPEITPSEAAQSNVEDAIAVTPSQPEAPAAPPQDTPKTVASNPQTSQDNVLRVDSQRIDTVLDLVGELIIGKSMMNQALSEFSKRFPRDPLRTKLDDAMAFHSQVLGKLQRSVMKVRMVPVEQLFRRFPRVVRDLAKLENKEVDLVLRGETTDLDKSLLDALAEPMMHLVRNAVDHGIETPAERLANGKPARATITLHAYHQGNQVIIEVTDDGRGIDRNKLVAKAIERGVIAEIDAEHLNETEAFNLMFHPGLSTAERVTDVSGRGIGMDIVHSVLSRLKGSVSIETDLGQGTTFRLRLPLTLAIIQALLFHAASRLYAVPVASVLEITRVNPTEIHKVDHHEVLRLRDDLLTLVRLEDVTGAASLQAQNRMFVIVMALAERKFGLVVDQLVGEEELVIKAMEDNLVATEMVSGASILGDGTVVLILNIAAVVEQLGKTTKQRRSSTRRAVAEASV